MAKVHISPNRTTDKTIRAIDRKREQERRKMFMFARDNSEMFATKLVQRLIDRHVIETSSVESIQIVFEKQLRQLIDMEEFDLQMKLAPARTLVQDPNIVSLYLTQFVIEDLINHADIQDIFGEDLEIYRSLDSVLKVLRPK
jgi:hypothetical protein